MPNQSEKTGQSAGQNNQKDSDVVILIPSRYGSSRFPGKPLAKIAGQTLIERVYRIAEQTPYAAYVVTDDNRIDRAVKEFGGQVLRVDDEVVSGSDRIRLAQQRHLPDAKVILNLQGDEPLMKPQLLNRLVEYHQRNAFEVSTMVRETTDSHQIGNPNLVKVVRSRATGQCFYFSRAVIPLDREENTTPSWFQHLGVYCYDVEVLNAVCQLPASSLERRESLEQLRFIEAGHKIGSIEVLEEFQGVDTPRDIELVELLIKKNQIK